jgi:hypothetical protein
MAPKRAPRDRRELSRLAGDTERLFELFSALLQRLIALEARMDALGAVPPRLTSAEASGSESPASRDEAPPPPAQATQDDTDTGREASAQVSRSDSDILDFNDLPEWMRAALVCVASSPTEPP